MLALVANVAAETNPLVVRLPTLALPSTRNTPLATKFAPSTLPDTLTIVPSTLVVVIFPTLALPITVKNPFVTMFPPPRTLPSVTTVVVIELVTAAVDVVPARTVHTPL